LGFKTSTSIIARHGVTQTGEFLADHLDMENSVEGVKIMATPVPGLLLAIDYKVSLHLPYFFKADAEGEFGVDVEVDFPLNVDINAHSPRVAFGEPQVKSKLTKSAQIVVGLQMGVVAQVEYAYVALCAGPVCAGPELWARQDVYVGLDAFAMTLDRSQATCSKRSVLAHGVVEQLGLRHEYQGVVRCELARHRLATCKFPKRSSRSNCC